MKIKNSSKTSKKKLPGFEFRADVQVCYRAIFPGGHRCTSEEANSLVDDALKAKPMGIFRMLGITDRLLLCSRLGSEKKPPWPDIPYAEIPEAYKLSNFTKLVVLAVETFSYSSYEFLMFMSVRYRDKFIKLLARHSEQSKYQVTMARPATFPDKGHKDLSNGYMKSKASTVIYSEPITDSGSMSSSSQYRMYQKTSRQTATRDRYTSDQILRSLLQDRGFGARAEEWMHSYCVLLISNPRLGPRASMKPDRLADAVIESHSAGVFAQYTLRCYSSHFSLHPMEADAPHLAHPQIRYTIIKTARKIIVADIPILLLRCRWENVTFFHIIMQFELSCELSNFQRIIETQARQVSMMDNDILQFTMMGR